MRSIWESSHHWPWSEVMTGNILEKDFPLEPASDAGLHGRSACLWAGDSRAYLLHGGRFRQLTPDYSLVQKLFDAGAISAAEALHHPSANIITRAIGAENLELNKVTDRLFPGNGSYCPTTACSSRCRGLALPRSWPRITTTLPAASSQRRSTATPMTMLPQ